jgi:hypothetical protein
LLFDDKVLLFDETDRFGLFAGVCLEQINSPGKPAYIQLHCIDAGSYVL